jgi:hypothetical protein
VPGNRLADVATAAINDGAMSYSPVEVSYDEALGVLKNAY